MTNNLDNSKVKRVKYREIKKEKISSFDNNLTKEVNMTSERHRRITPRKEDYSQWYLDIIAAAELAENSPVRGCMVIKPYGYAIWEKIQQQLDRMFKATDVVNAYFPLFIPLSLLTKEAQHVEGFAKECAVVTHHRLESDGHGGLVPTGKLEEPLIVRPTSETIMYSSYAKWVQSYRDLPILINQWCNIVRWEMRTRPFIRTMEFLWQEGHTAHATKDEAEARAQQMLEVYRDFAENYLALPVITGKKSHSETFAGADYTLTVEALMQDGKALQAGTSHLLGQNFAKAFDLKFLDQDGKTQYAWQTSWGVSTRLIGALIMTHGDDQGLVLPPTMAPYPVVIVPIWSNAGEKSVILEAAEKYAKEIKQVLDIEVKVDKRDGRPGPKFFEWEKKGVPLRLELGPKDLVKNQMVAVRRDTGEKKTFSLKGLAGFVKTELESIQHNLFQRAQQFRDSHTLTIDDQAEFEGKIQSGGFFRIHWCGRVECEAKMKERTTATIRCLSDNDQAETGKCLYCGQPSNRRVIAAIAY